MPPPSLIQVPLPPTLQVVVLLSVNALEQFTSKTPPALTVTAPESEPPVLPSPSCSVPPELIVIVPVPAAPLVLPLPNCSVPPLMVVVPPYLLTAVSSAVPVPVLSKPIVLAVPPRIMLTVPA